jgi:hypothetical protein
MYGAMPKSISIGLIIKRNNGITLFYTPMTMISQYVSTGSAGMITSSIARSLRPILLYRRK